MTDDARDGPSGDLTHDPAGDPAGGPSAGRDDLPRWAAVLSLALSCIAAASIFALMALVFVSVFFRYVLNSPIVATEDMMAILLGVTIFTALPSVTSGRGHISVDLLTGLFARVPAIDRMRRIVIDIGIVAMVLFMAKKILDQAVRYQDRETGTLVMDWPLHPVLYGFAALLALAALLFALRAWRDKGRVEGGGGVSL